MARPRWLLSCLLVGGLTLSVTWTRALAAVDAAAPGELLQAEPVTAATPEATPAPTPAATPEATPAPAPPGDTVEALAPYDFAHPHLLLPYYLTAYTPAQDHTELNLGLFLSQVPGIDVSLGWGAVENVMAAAKVSAFGASSTVGLGLKYLAVPETPDSSKPAVALWMQGLFLNHRTLGDVRKNVFRGNRLQVGAILSKDLGILARALNASRALRDWLAGLRVHAEVLGEYQTGREGENEAGVSRAEFGARAGIEATIEMERWYAYLVLDTLPDWVNEENYYAGVRFYSQPDLAFDLVAGRLQNTPAALLAISWLF